MANLFILRHFISQWNEENRFAGWTDGPLAKNRGEESKRTAELLSQFKIGKIYSSSLFRNMDTIAEIYENIPDKYPFFIHLDSGKMQKWAKYADITNQDMPIFVSENLNERYYGILQGENKEKATEKYGKDQVQLWRRSYDIAPPKGESLKDVEKRVMAFFNKYIKKDLLKGENVLIVASHNSLRAIARNIEKIDKKDIINYEIPYGGLIKYELGKNLEMVSKKLFNTL